MNYAERQGPPSKLNKLCVVIRCGPLTLAGARIVGTEAVPFEFIPVGATVWVGDDACGFRVTEPGYNCHVALDGNEWAIPDRMLIPKHDPDPEQHTTQELEVSA